MSPSQNDLRWLTQRPIAHRGLHDGNGQVCENSLSAFEAAIKGGYAIECDVRLSRDGVPVVFHDGELDRLTKAEGRVIERTANELGALRLGDTGDTIPTFASMLEFVAGRVPIVAELKGTTPEEDAGFLDRLAPLIETYDGLLALMSFDSWLLEQSDALEISVPIGLTAEGTRGDALERHRVVFERRCSFVSYNVHHLPNSFIEWVRTDQQRPVISWTVRSHDDVERSQLHADQMTFEGFLPSL